MKLGRGGWMTGAVLLGLAIYAFISLLSMRAKMTEANRAENELRRELERLQEENAALEYALEHQNDPETIEDIARSELGLVMPDEVIFYDAGE